MIVQTVSSSTEVGLSGTKGGGCGTTTGRKTLTSFLVCSSIQASVRQHRAMAQPPFIDRRRRQCVSCFMLLTIFLLFSLPASAADYTVNYAFDGKEHVETGSAECEFRYYCSLKIKDSGVSLLLGFRDVRRTRIGISVYGDRRSDCCFFSDGVHSVSRDVSGSSLIRLQIYEGHARKGNEFLQNLPIGLLYLKISQQK